ncbi:hypothetical protein FS749_000822 [Ceratobasidium sp. UAMH 11750]|nr:hypothetical protein FS749_000822 [Ceratobasidium sp. UAMH 11750]
MDVELNPAFSYQPPPGGDILLKSSDGVAFLAHSLLLRLSSSVFADMFSTATQNDPIELSDDAESVSLMLRFIYPPVFMDDLPIDLLEKSLRVGQKYDISGITTAVDHLMSHSSNMGSLIRSDPIRAFCLAAKYGLPKTHKAAREAMRPGDFEFKDTKQIKPLAETFSNASSVIEMLGAHCIRTRSLLNLFLGANLGPILPRTRESDTGHWDIMMCGDCFSELGHLFGEEVAYEPSWVFPWRVKAFYNIATRPLEGCHYLFQVAILNTLQEEASVCLDCIRAAHDARAGLAFDFWAYDVKSKVKKILSEAEGLYNL